MAAIELIGPAWDKLKTSRRQKEAEARIRIDREMESLADEFGSLLRRAKEEGGKITDIARRMGASRTAVYSYLGRSENAAGDNVTADTDAGARYSFDADENVLTVRLDAEAEVSLWKEAGWAGHTPSDGRELDVAQFEVEVLDDGRTFLEPITRLYTPGDPGNHPVVHWMTYDKGNEKAAITWLKDNMRH